MNRSKSPRSAHALPDELICAALERAIERNARDYPEYAITTASCIADVCGSPQRCAAALRRMASRGLAERGPRDRYGRPTWSLTPAGEMLAQECVELPCRSSDCDEIAMQGEDRCPSCLIACLESSAAREAERADEEATCAAEHAAAAAQRAASAAELRERASWIAENLDRLVSAGEAFDARKVVVA